MAITQIQSTSGRAGAASVTVTFNSTPTLSNRLFAAVMSQNKSASTVSLNGTGWTPILQVDHPTSACSLSLFSKIAGASEPTAVQATSTASSSVDLHLIEYSGLTATSPRDAYASGTAVSQLTFSTGTTILTAQPNELWLAAWGGNALINSPQPTYSNSFTEVEMTARLITASKIVSSTGQAESTVTLGTSAATREIGMVVTVGLNPQKFFTGWGVPL